MNGRLMTKGGEREWQSKRVSAVIRGWSRSVSYVQGITYAERKADIVDHTSVRIVAKPDKRIYAWDRCKEKGHKWSGWMDYLDGKRWRKKRVCEVCGVEEIR